MHDEWLLFAAYLTALLGMGWLALAMNAHWRQVYKGTPSARTVSMLRRLGGLALFLSLALCLKVDHASMAALVWIMLLAASAMTIAFTLTLRAHWLRVLLLPFAPRSSS